VVGADVARVEDAAGRCQGVDGGVQTLRRDLTVLGVDELSEEDKVVVARARRIQQFLSQNTYMAKKFTGLLDLRPLLLDVADAADVEERLLGDVVEVTLDDRVERLDRDKVVVARARRIQQFLSQNTYMAKKFTGVEGSTVPIKETIESFDAIVKGDFDHVAEQAFFNVGGNGLRHDEGGLAVPDLLLGGDEGDGQSHFDSLRSLSARISAVLLLDLRPLLLDVADAADVEESLVVAKTVEGEIGFMSGHEPVLAILAEGQVRITQADGSKVIASADDGFLSAAGSASVPFHARNHSPRERPRVTWFLERKVVSRREVVRTAGWRDRRRS
jgi:hypothetical protein